MALASYSTFKFQASDGALDALQLVGFADERAPRKRPKHGEITAVINANTCHRVMQPFYRPFGRQVGGATGSYITPNRGGNEQDQSCGVMTCQGALC
jgi:hypothetical protein